MKKKLARGEPSVGSWVTIAHPSVAEVVAQAGFDWVAIDMEHGVVDLESVQALIQAMNGTPVVPLVRVPWHDAVTIKRALETGAQGLIIPQVRTADETRAVVAAAQYPPSGIRSIGYQKPAGLGGWFGEHLRRTNDNSLIVVQIDHVGTIPHLREIVTVEGLDAVLICANSLSASMGLVGQRTHPDVLCMIEEIHAACLSVDLPSGIVAYSPDDANERIAEGFKFIGIGHDAGFLRTICGDICRRVRWK